NPCSGKGEVRAKIATMLLDEMRAGNIRAMILRSADVYGPGAVSSLTHATVIERIRSGKASPWIGNPEAGHTFTFTPDAGKAVALLGNSDEAFGQTWHVPTSTEPMTGERFVRLACEVARRPYELRLAPPWLLWLTGVFIPVLRENREMMYQFDYD